MTGSKYNARQRSNSGADFARELDRISLWLLRGFGLIDLEQGTPIAGKPWHPAAVRRSHFGIATFAALMRSRDLPYRERVIFNGHAPDIGQREHLPEELDPGSPDAPPGLRDGVKFDALQPTLRPHWPAWQRSLTLPPLPFREGTFTFKVSVGKVWRRIAIPARKTVNHLSDAILAAVDFDFDHLWEFKFLDRIGREVSIVHPMMLDSSESHKGETVLIGDLPLAEAESMTFRYDFGDNWQFDVTLESVDAGDKTLKRAKKIESHGKAPEQYGDWF